VEHFYDKFGDPSCNGFLRYRAENQTDIYTNGGKKTLPLRLGNNQRRIPWRSDRKAGRRCEVLSRTGRTYREGRHSDLSDFLHSLNCCKKLF